MFVRFRERKNDGRQPDENVQAEIACAGRCTDKERHRVGGGMRTSTGCQMRPRCRWRIGTDEGLALVPYTLLVSLVETRRVNGKVKQTHIADLGAIEGYHLPAFFAGIEPERVKQIIAVEEVAINVRAWFWNQLEDRLARLANRIDAATADTIRAAIAARIPPPTTDESARVEAWLARVEMEGMERTCAWWEGFVTDAQKAIKEHEQDIAEERRRIEVYRPAADEVADEVRKFQAASARGDQSAMDRLRMILREANMGAGQILALKMGRRRPSS